MIIERLSQIGDSAGSTKRPMTLSAALRIAATQTNARYGNRITLRSDTTYHSASPGQMRRDWLKTAIATSTTLPVASRSQLATLLTSAKAPVFSPPRISSWSLGTKAAVSAPSPSRRRKRFGRRKAVTNASCHSPAPNAAALSESRASPRKRDTTVSTETMPMFLSFFDTRRVRNAVPRARPWRSGAGGASAYSVSLIASPSIVMSLAWPSALAISSGSGWPWMYFFST